MQVLGSILRFLFAWIDGIVAKVITLVYGLLMDLANLTLYSENIVKVIGQRIGILLGIFMLFRLSVSLINYMISPDKFSDSKQGGGALIRNVIISLVLLATVNIIFETAYSVQQKVVNSQIIEKIFFGETSQTKMDIGYYLYTGFFTPNPDVVPECNDMWNPTFDLANSQCNLDLGEVVETNALNSIHDARNNLDMSKVFSNYDVVMANKDGAFKGKMVFNYTPIVSTAAGVITLLIMISFSMELAKRAIKLLFLQIVAPVPIIFNMDTGKGKDVFQKWYKQCFNTYISVFIRLLAIDFAVFIIVLLKGEFSSIFQDKLGVNIFIIIGCLLFAKEVPKLIEDMMGIKLDGMSLRPLKKLEDQALFGKQATGLVKGAAAGAIGIGAGAIGAGIASAKLGNKWWQTTGATVRGAGRGMFGGISAGYKSKNAFDAIGAGFGRLGANADYVNSLDGTDLRGRLLAGAQQRLHVATEADLKKKDIENLNSFERVTDAALKRGEAESVKYNDLALSNGFTMAQHKQEQEKLNRLRNDVKDYTEYLKYEGIDTNIASMNDWMNATKIKKGEFESNASFEKRVEQGYKRYVNDMNEKIKESKVKFEEYKLNHDAELQRLNDKVNIDTKKFATAYLDAIENETLYKDGKLVIDGEISNYINQAEQYEELLKERKINVGLRDANHNLDIKEAKQRAVVAKHDIESRYIGEEGHKYNQYKRDQANAAATKPKGKK